MPGGWRILGDVSGSQSSSLSHSDRGGTNKLLKGLNFTSIDFPNADSAIGVNVGMEKLRFESHLGGVEWVVLGEGQRGDEDSVLEVSSLWTCDGSFPFEKVVLRDWTSSNSWR